MVRIVSEARISTTTIVIVAPVFRVHVSLRKIDAIEDRTECMQSFVFIITTLRYVSTSSANRSFSRNLWKLKKDFDHAALLRKA